MGAHSAVEALMGPRAAAHLVSTVTETDAGAACNALVDLNQVVNFVTPATAKLSTAASTGTSALS